MTVLFYTGFDHYTTPTNRWDVATTSGSGSSAAISSSGGRFGNGMRFALPNGGTYWAEKSIPSVSTVYAGVAFRTSRLTDGNVILTLRENTTHHLELRMLADGRLYVTRNGTTLVTGLTSLLTANVWHRIEMKAVIHDTTGEVRVRINGVEDIVLTGADTRNGGTGVITVFTLGMVNTGPNSTGFSLATNLDYDDVYVVDNAFQGDVRCESVLPSGNGNSSVLVGSDANSTDNYLLVDEAAPNDDTDYVASAVAGDKDTYAMGNPTPTATAVVAVQVHQWARKTDAGARSLSSVARLSATEVDSTAQALSTSYGYVTDIRETKPGGGAWALADVNGVEVGPKVA